MKKWIFIIFIFFHIHIFPCVVRAASCPADDPCKDISNIQEKVSCYSNIVNICATERESMSAQVTYLTSKIELTETKIEESKEKITSLEQEIADISGKIEQLELSLTRITGMLIDRIKYTYKYSGTSNFNLLLTSQKLAELLNRYKYIQTVQSHDRKLLFQLQNSKLNFKDQKELRENKRKELEIMKKQLEKEEVNLDIQKREKEVFLAVTKKNERIYQQNLTAARREAQQIQQAVSMLSQAGVSKRVNKGDVVGIMGNTGFSTGPHLHFAVYILKESDMNRFNFDAGYENPFNYLQARELLFNANSCDEIGSNLRKTVGSGSWSWPMKNPTITQCYGHTPYSYAYYKSGIHNGIDMFDDTDPLIRAVDSGNAYSYKGGQSAGNGVFIFHDNGKMTLYWHLQN